MFFILNKEIYCDFYPLNVSLFSFNEPSLKLFEGACSNISLSRIIDGVSSYFFASRSRPTIRYSQNSNDCTVFAREINVKPFLAILFYPYLEFL